MKITKTTDIPLTNVLAVQDHYYLLWDGTRYGRHGGSIEDSGLLVFENLERAEQFCMTVAKGTGFIPVRVDGDEFLKLAIEVGAFCVSEGLTVKVCTMRPKNGYSV